MTDKHFTTTINGVPLSFHTHQDLFSPNHPDTGTRAMLSCVALSPDDKVLDLGCGYGLVGILAAKLIGPDRVTMVDSSDLCIEYARRNAAENGVPSIRIVKSDGLADIDDAGFTLILCNPPYHVDFDVPKRFVHKGFNRMALGGRFVMVTKRLLWYKNKLTGIFGGVKVREVDGYYVFESIKKGMTYAKVENPAILKKSRKRARQETADRHARASRD
jgi:16S rRNA (guanine1207-N2)-methyltransferase